MWGRPRLLCSCRTHWAATEAIGVFIQGMTLYLSGCEHTSLKELDYTTRRWDGNPSVIKNFFFFLKRGEKKELINYIWVLQPSTSFMLDAMSCDRSIRSIHSKHGLMLIGMRTYILKALSYNTRQGREFINLKVLKTIGKLSWLNDHALIVLNFST